MLIPGTPAWNLFCEADAREMRETERSPELARQVARVAAALADGLAGIVPPDFRVYVSHGIVWIDQRTSRPGASGTGFVTTVVANVNAGASLDEARVSASENVLARIQDRVTEERCVPWPPDPAGGRFAFAAGHAEIVNGDLRVWFASRDGLPVTEVVSLRL